MIAKELFAIRRAADADNVEKFLESSGQERTLQIGLQIRGSDDVLVTCGRIAIFAIDANEDGCDMRRIVRTAAWAGNVRTVEMLPYRNVRAAFIVDAIAGR